MKKKFNQDEVKFLYDHLRNLIESKSGCHVPGTDIMCPYWDPTPENDTPGFCTVKKSNRVCTKLELSLVDDSLVLEVRPKTKEDYIEEFNQEVQLCKSQVNEVTKQMKELSNGRQELLLEIQRLEKKRESLLSKESNDE